MKLILQFIIDFPFSQGILLFLMTRNMEVPRSTYLWKFGKVVLWTSAMIFGVLSYI